MPHKSAIPRKAIAKSLNTVRTFLETKKIEVFRDALDAAEPRPDDELHVKDRETAREQRKNYAQRLSEGCAVLISNQLRRSFDGILPGPKGEKQESRARTGKGVKKLDVNYSTPELGLGLGVSIKTLNFRDPKSQRYTKNPTRIDNELRAEASDYHERQPYAVLVAAVFIPFDACQDGVSSKGTRSWSSFAQIVSVLKHRAGRSGPRDDVQLFERVYVGLYQHRGPNRGDLRFCDTRDLPPRFGEPVQTRSIDEFIADVIQEYDRRNRIEAKYAGEDVSTAAPLTELLDTNIVSPGEDDDD